MKKVLGILLALAIIAALLVLYLLWPESEELSYLESAGDPYQVRILRDTWGVPHVFGDTDADAAYGLAYAHAEDDFLTIQQTALAARGKLATVYGADAAPNDYMVQLLRIWDVVDEKYETLSPEVRAISEAYAAGLNHYAALHESEALYGLFPVTGKDVIAGSVHKSPLFFGLESTLAELFRDERQSTISPRLDEAELLSLYGTSAGAGSNAIAVGPARSADGQTFLAVNAHQPWTGPVAWYEAHVHSEDGWDMVGALFPGMPLFAHGHNQNLGWAFTVNHADRADVYVLETDPEDSYRYLFDGEWLELEKRPAPIVVKLFGRFRWTVTEEALWSVYGPAVQQDHGTYAIRYAGMGQLGIYEQLFRMNKAADFAEWLEAMRLLEMPTFNVAYADRESNIYYLYNGLLPLRDPNYDWQQYLPGNTSETLWTEYASLEELPQVLNPASGFVVNTNHTPFQTTVGSENPDPQAYPASFGIETELNNRAMRALALFSGDPAITEDEFQTYKFDMAYAPESQMGDYLRRLFDAPVPDELKYQNGLAVLRDWDLNTTPESRGAALAILTAYLLKYEPAEELSDEQIVAAYVEAIDLLLQQHGGIDVPWAGVNRLRRGELDLGLGGGPDILHAVYGELDEHGRLVAYTGDAYVLLVTWDKDGRVHSQSIHQFGSATLDEDSPHYNDQSPLFVRRELKPVWMEEAIIRENLASEYAPGQEAP